MFVCRKLEILQTIEQLGGSAGYSKNPGAFEHIITVSWLLALWSPLSSNNESGT